MLHFANDSGPLISFSELGLPIDVRDSVLLPFLKVRILLKSVDRVRYCVILLGGRL